jgi:hypothetical protein
MNQEELEEFEFLLSQWGNYSFSGLDYGYLGQLLNGNLDAVTQDNELSRRVLSLTSELEPKLRILGQMEESCNYLRETLSKPRGGIDQLAPDMRLAYDIKSLKSSDEHYLCNSEVD